MSTLIPGYAAKFYVEVEDGTEGPYWLEVNIVKDVNVDVLEEMVDVTTRALGGVKGFVPVTTDVTFELSYFYDAENPLCVYFQELFDSRMYGRFLAADGDVEDADTKGPWMYGHVASYKEGQPVNGIVTVDISIKLAGGAPTPAYGLIEDE